MNHLRTVPSSLEFQSNLKLPHRRVGGYKQHPYMWIHLGHHRFWGKCSSLVEHTVQHKIGGNDFTYGPTIPIRINSDLHKFTRNPDKSLRVQQSTIKRYLYRSKLAPESVGNQGSHTHTTQTQRCLWFGLNAYSTEKTMFSVSIAKKCGITMGAAFLSASLV